MSDSAPGGPDNSLDHPVLQAVRRALPAEPRVWLVGGAVRDALLRRRLKDLDFAVAGDGLALARAVGDALGAPAYPLDAERGVGRIMASYGEHDMTLDFASLRGPDLAADLAARDFTINAIAVDLAQPEALIDPLGGQADLRGRRLRLCSPNAIIDDPLRAVRAVRLAVELGLRFDPPARAAIRAEAGSLARVSAERRRDEFVRCLASPRPAGALRVLDALGLLPHLLPEAGALKGLTQSPPHVHDVWEHTLQVITRLRDVLSVLAPIHDVDAASDLTLGLVSVRLGRHRDALHDHLERELTGGRTAGTLLMLAALLHDVGKPATRSTDPDGRIRFLGHEQVGAEMAAERLNQLRFSADEQAHVRTMVAHHMRPLQMTAHDGPSRRAIYRYFRDAGTAGVDIALLSLADFLGKHADGPPPTHEWNRLLDVGASLLQAYFERQTEVVAPPALLNGHDLAAELGVAQGPRVGQLLAALREAQAVGEVADRPAALEYVRSLLAQE